jgi:hypothetical protein
MLTKQLKGNNSSSPIEISPSQSSVQHRNPTLEFARKSVS